MTTMPPFHDFIRSQDPLVSVVMPSYNKASFLPETVACVVAQNYPQIEILIVNDGSPDNTSEIARALAAQYPGAGIRLLEKPNGGISDARNFAIERATGRVIINLDGDDIAKPGYIREALRIMRETGANLVTSNVELFGIESGEWIPAAYDDYFERYSNLIPTLIMYDRELWRQAGGYKRAFPFNEDWDFFITTQRCGVKVGRIEEKLFRYRMTESGLANQYIKDSWPRSVSLMMTSNHSMYCIDEVLNGHSILSEMPENWALKLEAQDRLHPHEWLLKFWLGLVSQHRGDIQGAISLYSKAIELTQWKEWQPLYRLAMILDVQGNRQDTANLLHLVRTQRPDMKRFVDERINSLLGQG